MGEKMLSLFLALTGLGIIVYWIIFIINGGLPNGIYTIKNDTYIIAHILPELFTAILGLIGGHGLFHNLKWGNTAGVFSCGLFAYSGLNNLSRVLLNDMIFPAIFISIFLIALSGFICLIKKSAA